MFRLKSAVCGIAIAAGSVSSAFAGAGLVTTVVTPLQSNVTYSSPGTNYLGYTVDIANGGGNTINNIRATFATGVRATDTAELATFVAADGGACVASADGTSVTCTVGQLSAGGSFPRFALFFKAPAKVTNGVADDLGQDAIVFSGTTIYAEGTGGVPQSPPDNSVTSWSAPAVALGTANDQDVRTAVLKTGGNVFTGDGVAATGADVWATSVSVPAAASYTTAQIQESTSPITCAPDLLTCNTSTLTIPGSFANLVITLRRDVSTIAKSAKIANAQISYDNPAHPNPLVTYPLNVPACTDTTYGALPQSGIPCIDSRKEYKKSDNPRPTAAQLGDWEFVIKALDNGKYIN